MILAVLLGLALGFGGSIPVAGPIAVMVVTWGVQGRYLSGIFLAAGCALAESAYAGLAFWGLHTLLATYDFIVPATRALACVVLIPLGIILMRRRTLASPSQNMPERRGSSFALGFAITALNPTLLATWSVAVATLMAADGFALQPGDGIPFACGVACGTTAWFTLLLLLLRRYRERFSQRTLLIVVRVLGIVLTLLGGWFLVTFLRYLLGV